MSKLFSSSVPDERAEALVDRYDLRDLTAPTDGSASFTDGFFFGGWEVEGWSPLRQSTHVVEGRRVHTAVWTKAGAKNEAGDPPVAVKVEVTECASERDARAALLEALDITMSVDVLQRTEDGPGEVALLPRSKDEPATGLFVRSNCLVRVSNAEREVVPVNTFFQVDRLFFGPVEAVSNAAAPDVRVLIEGAEGSTGEPVPLPAEAADPLDRDVWLRFLSEEGGRFGRLQEKDAARVYFTSDVEGEFPVQVFAVSENGSVSRTETQVFIR